ncbi:type III PLP-dependent enzyme domain-containing protein [Phycicoccus flavus]|uniref:diaminopimelate decarboxylase n=1 Tax=Phycicoccus flavus TaxID=2502783 RepID=UPI000FEB9E61|nr:diaminopimelate decarboxylase [Phycicoccus flavus]NHA66750.1 diaminopimelate decarboxylase [Phycicoccus flavus]
MTSQSSSPVGLAERPDTPSTWLERPSGALVRRVADAALASGLVGPDDGAVVLHDLDLLDARIAELRAAFPPHAVHTVAVKANPVLEILRACVAAGAGLEAASWEEVALSLAAGCPPERVVYDSPAKTRTDIARALAAGVHVNADSLDELDRVIEVREDHPDSTATVGLRVNPLVGGGSIPATSVASPSSRFGEKVGDDLVEALAARAEGRPWLRGLHSHVGSQGMPLETLVAAAPVVERFRDAVHRRLGHDQLDVVDLGGGATTNYVGETAVDPRELASRMREAAPSLFGPDVTLVTEFGRAVQANCGWALNRVEYVNRSLAQPVAVTHLGADFLMRVAYVPGHWQHRISRLATVADEPAEVAGTAPGTDPPEPSESWIVSGPLCFAGDVISQDARFPALEAGDWLVIHDTGAYTMSMWSRHCNRGMPAVLGYRDGADGPVLEVLRERESADDVVRQWSRGAGH